MVRMLDETGLSGLVKASFTLAYQVLVLVYAVGQRVTPRSPYK